MRSAIAGLLALVLSACSGTAVLEPPRSDRARSACPAGPHGPEMVEVPAPDGSRYCIDATEISVARFRAWFGAGMPSELDPGLAEQCPEHKIDPDLGESPNDQGEDYPVLVHWCEADAFCRANGKRLCGAIGGGTLDIAYIDDDGDVRIDPMAPDLVDPRRGEWLNACSRGGELPFGYGASHAEGACATDLDLAPTGSHPACEGGFDGLFDMLGNAGEWVATCVRMDNEELESPWRCMRRGTFPEGGCDYPDVQRDTSPQGFRCCANVLAP